MRNLPSVVRRRQPSVALATLALAWLARDPHPVLSVFWVGFLSLPVALLLPAAGAVAGLVGSLLSLGRKHTRRVTRLA